MLWPSLKDLETSNTEYNNINDANTLALRRAAYYQILVQIIQLKRWHVPSVIIVVSIYLWLYESVLLVILVPMVVHIMITNKERILQGPLPVLSSCALQKGTFCKLRIRRQRDPHDWSRFVETALVTFKDEKGFKHTAPTPFLNKYILEGVERGYPLIVASAKGFLGKKGYVIFLEEFFSESDDNFVPWGLPPFVNSHYDDENED